jgi:carbamoyl-phosphate synthase large subunit
MINILVTGAGGGVGQGIIKSLKMISDIDINIIAADMSALATGMYASNKSYLVPACNSTDYMTRLEEIFKLENINYYFPGTDVELEFCANNKKKIKDNFRVQVVISNLDAILISDDKYKTYKFLKENNFYYPKTFLASENNSEEISYPTIMKPAVGCRSIGVGIVYNKDELESRLLNEKGLVIQELIGSDNTEYTCTIVILNDKISEVLILKRILRSGDTFRAEPIENKLISNYVTEVAIALSIEGSCNFQLRMDKNNIPKIFEINCRYSGTTPFCSQLGFNPVEFYLKSSMNVEYNYSIDYDSMVLRNWSEVLVSKNVIAELDREKKVQPTYNRKIDLFDKVI